MFATKALTFETLRDVITKVRNSPALVRTVPFALFLALTYVQGKFGEDSRYWVYALKTVLGAGMLWAVWSSIKELTLKFSWEAVLVGVGVAVMWVGLDGFYPSLNNLIQDYLCPFLRKLGLDSWCPEPSNETTPDWNPLAQYGAGLGWFYIVIRTLGSTLVVPPLEEVFYRSFLYRYIVKPEFESVPLGKFLWVPFIATALFFGFTHHQWLAGILCGFAYQGLVCWKKRLGDAIVAHGITNLLLAVWIVTKGDWRFW